MTSPERERVELVAERVVAGGDAIAHDAEGRVVFVHGAIPGERVVARVVDRKKDFGRAVTLDVIDPSPDRVAAPCTNVALGCGGCGWQHIAVARQLSLKEEMVRDALRRIAGIDAPAMSSVSVADRAFRTTARVAVRDGRAHFRRSGSHDLTSAAGCWVAHPLLAELLDDASFGDATEAVVRVAQASSERAALLLPRSARGWTLPPDVDAVTRPAPGRGVVHEDVRGNRLRVSIGSFFQSSPQAASALVDGVLDALEAAGEGVPPSARGITVADLYGGVGLFAAAIARSFESRVELVERSASAVADARHNLAGLEARVARSDVAEWRAGHAFDAVVADPSRPGLGRPGVDAVVRCSPGIVVLVSCDAASLARDVRLLAAKGYCMTSIRLVDAFAHTPHVEAVTAFRPV